MTMEHAYGVPQWTMGDRLRKAREFAGIGTAEFADAIGVSRGTITNYERDKVQPRRVVLMAWAMRTGVPLSWLTTGENPRPETPDGGSKLPRLDSNQQPFVYSLAQARAERRTGERAA